MNPTPPDLLQINHTLASRAQFKAQNIVSQRDVAISKEELMVEIRSRATKKTNLQPR